MSLQLNWEKLSNRLTMKTKKFTQLGSTKMTADGPCIFIDNGASVLGVAHLDSVGKDQPYFEKTSRGSCIVESITLDDRLGVCILLDILPQLDLKFDILLTDSEEVGLSTAGAFTDPPRQYNWMFQFDRAGTDVVMYDYETRDRLAMLELLGFQTGRGSFSDICYLEHLGCAGFNFGCGYHNQHTQNCFVDLRESEMMIFKFAEFYDSFHEEHMPHEKRNHWRGTEWCPKQGRYVKKSHGYQTGGFSGGHNYNWYDKKDNYQTVKSGGFQKSDYSSDIGSRYLPAKYRVAQQEQQRQAFLVEDQDELTLADEEVVDAELVDTELEGESFEELMDEASKEAYREYWSVYENEMR